MATIQDYLGKIAAAIYGKDVRQSIIDAIKQCYYDGKAGTIDLQARENIADIEKTKADTSYVVKSLAKLSAGSPTYAPNLEWLVSNGDINKVYLLPNGNIAGFINQDGLALFKNLVPDSVTKDGLTIYGDDQDNDGKADGYRNNVRLRTDGIEEAELAGQCASGFIPVTVGDVIRVKGLTTNNNFTKLVGYDSTFITRYDNFFVDVWSDSYWTITTDEDGTWVCKLTNSSIAWVRVTGVGDGANMIITKNEEIVWGEETFAWTDMGIKYANYALTDADKEAVAQEVLDMLEVSYVAVDNVVNVGTYTLKYDDADDAEAIGEVTT